MTGSELYQMRKFKGRKAVKEMKPLNCEEIKEKPATIGNFDKKAIKTHSGDPKESFLDFHKASLEHKETISKKFASESNAIDKNKKTTLNSEIGSFDRYSTFCDDILASNDKSLKRAIVELTLKTFLNGKRPANVRFYKYIDRFKIFSVYSLAQAAAFLKLSSFVSKSDVRSFIYIFLAFSILSTKLQDDFSIWNSLYNERWNLSLRQIASLEILALSGIDYNLEVENAIIEEILLSSIEYKQKYKI